MIEQVDIGNFGSFKSFVWKNTVKDKGNNVARFRKLNILYGRNYSGKTTLSRVFRSLETGILPDRYENPVFAVTIDGVIVTHSQVRTALCDVRVYNQDFVSDHLSFLRDPAGKIAPFAIVGSENKSIEQEIAQNEQQLGSAEGQSGLRHAHALKTAELLTKQRARDAAERDLKAKLTSKATNPQSGIKHNPLYRDPNYNTPKIEADIETIQSRSIQPFDEKVRKEKEAVLSETALPDIEKRLEFIPRIHSVDSTARQLLSKRITPTKPIQALLEDAVLQAWVKQGMPLHRNKRHECGFCGQQLPSDLWKKLDEHFSEESAQLESEIQRHIVNIDNERGRLDSILTLESNHFYASLRSSLEAARESLSSQLVRYGAALDRIAGALHSRLEDIFNTKPVPQLEDSSQEILDSISRLNELMDRNNRKTESLSEDQQKVREQLRLSEIAQFIRDIQFPQEEAKVATLRQEADVLSNEVEELQTRIRGLEERIAEFKLQLKDERKGADKVNEYLNHYFGHGGLRLEAVEEPETSTYRFQIVRGDEPAYNLSEGECSLIAFCYFFAKLEDVDTKGKKLAIYIDDPVSSLDSNHIFFVFSLIENLIARPETDDRGNRITDSAGRPVYRYEQLFISTHNLEFLKYLKRLSSPKNDHEHFLVVGREDCSGLELMPLYLKNYITEFNHLFGEIYTCSDPANAATESHCPLCQGSCRV